MIVITKTRLKEMMDDNFREQLSRFVTECIIFLENKGKNFTATGFYDPKLATMANFISLIKKIQDEEI